MDLSDDSMSELDDDRHLRPGSFIYFTMTYFRTGTDPCIFPISGNTGLEPNNILLDSKVMMLLLNYYM